MESLIIEDSNLFDRDSLDDDNDDDDDKDTDSLDIIPESPEVNSIDNVEENQSTESNFYSVKSSPQTESNRSRNESSLIDQSSARTEPFRVRAPSREFPNCAIIKANRQQKRGKLLDFRNEIQSIQTKLDEEILKDFNRLRLNESEASSLVSISNEMLRLKNSLRLLRSRLEQLEIKSNLIAHEKSLRSESIDEIVVNQTTDSSTEFIDSLENSLIEIEETIDDTVGHHLINRSSIDSISSKFSSQKNLRNLP